MSFERIEFDETSHTYRVNGVIVPGVTSILKAAGYLPDFDYVDPSLLAYKGDLGTAVHDATALDDMGVLDEESLDPILVPYVNAWRQFRLDVNFIAAEIELPVYSAQYQYAGKLDRIGLINGEWGLLDIKTSSIVDLMGVGPQTAAYKRGYEEWSCSPNKIKRRWAVKLCPNEPKPYRLIPCDNPQDESAFLYALFSQNWRCIKHARA